MPKAATFTNREKSERTLGSLFVAARERRGIPVEKAAHDTRIRPSRLREIEADDFSHFAHPSYARLFLTDYARYLGIPVEDIRHFLPEKGECGTEGYQYLQEVITPTATPSLAFARPPQRRVMPYLVTACLIPVLGVVGLFGYTTFRKVQQLNSHPTVAMNDLPAKPDTSPTFTAPHAVDPTTASAETATVDSASTEATAPAPAASPEAVVDRPASAPVASPDHPIVVTSPEYPSAPSDTPAAVATTTSEAQSSEPQPAAAASPVPGVSPQQSIDDHAALLVGGTTDSHGRVQ